MCVLDDNNEAEMDRSLSLKGSQEGKPPIKSTLHSTCLEFSIIIISSSSSSSVSSHVVIVSICSIGVSSSINIRINISISMSMVYEY